MFMKRIKSRIAVILTLMMIISAFEVMGVFAEPEEHVYSVSALSGLASYSSYNSVVLEWNKSTVTDKGAPTEDNAKYRVNGSEVSTQDLGNGRVRYAVPNLTPGVDTAFTVEPFYKDTEGKEEKGSAATVTDAAVRTIAYRVTIKKSGTLKSHGGPRMKMKVKKGQKIDCYGFGGGKYIFKNEYGSIFYCNMTRTGKKKCIYTKAWNYTPQEAEFFVNAKGLYSKTGSLIWINTYTQHLYVFKGAPGSWKCINDFDCSTGKASSPSPTGVSGKKALWKRIKSRHGIPYWSLYSDINAIHAKKKSWKIGVPSSNGCVRNYKQNAKFVWDNAPIGTRVLLY